LLLWPRIWAEQKPAARSGCAEKRSLVIGRPFFYNRLRAELQQPESPTIFKAFSYRAFLFRAALLYLGVSLPAAAFDSDTYDDPQPVKGYQEGPAWTESQTELPPFPPSGDLVELPEQPLNAALTVLVDIGQVHIGEDGVVRYTLVLRSASGAENVFFEGIRCSTLEWKTFAYGSQGHWRPMDSGWRPLENKGAGRYRYILYQHYLCEPGGLRLQLPDIKQRLRYGPEFDDE